MTAQVIQADPVKRKLLTDQILLRTINELRLAQDKHGVGHLPDLHLWRCEWEMLGKPSRFVGRYVRVVEE